MSIEEQLAAVRREVAMRERVYPRWVEAGRMTAEKADHEIEAMKNVAATLQHLLDEERGQGHLF